MNDTVQIESIVLFEGLRKHIADHAERENLKGGYEAVGFVAARIGDKQISTAVPLHNHSSNPTETYFVEPWEQFQAESKLGDAGYEIVGTYHSHPASEARPSKSDEGGARTGELLLIYSVTFEELTCWREREGSLHPVELVFVDPDRE